MVVGFTMVEEASTDEEMLQFTMVET